MLNESTLHSREIITIASQLMTDYFQKSLHFSKVIQLSEPDRRNLILRLIIDQPTTGMPETLILKKTVTEKGVFDNKEGETEAEQLSRFAHDWAGLEFLTQIGGHHAPQFYAGSLEQKFIVIEDLGLSHPSLVGPLTRSNTLSNQEDAHRALASYMHRLGKMHADTATKSSHFVSILKKIYPQTNRLYMPEAPVSNVITQAKFLTKSELRELQDEINDVLAFTLMSNEFNVLLHGDICPDNVYYQGDEVKLIDFEFGDFGNALIDGTYLRMCMPSSWCSKAVPEKVVHQMESIYRAELQKKVLIAGDDAIYNKHLIYACAYWVIRTMNQLDEMDLIDHEWVCPSGPVDADSQWESEKNTFRPRILSRLAAFITSTKESGHLPKLCKTSINLLEKLKKIWPETTFIDIFPVFKG